MGCASGPPHAEGDCNVCDLLRAELTAKMEREGWIPPETVVLKRRIAVLEKQIADQQSAGAAMGRNPDDPCPFCGGPGAPCIAAWPCAVARARQT